VALGTFPTPPFYIHRKPGLLSPLVSIITSPLFFSLDARSKTSTLFYLQRSVGQFFLLTRFYFLSVRGRSWETSVPFILTPSFFAKWSFSAPGEWFVDQVSAVLGHRWLLGPFVEASYLCVCVLWSVSGTLFPRFFFAVPAFLYPRMRHSR